MIRRRTPSNRRAGAALPELALVMMFVLVPTMIGVWEVGRLVQVQQIVSNSAREGARVAAQGYTINQTGSPTEVMTMIPPASNPNGSPNVKAAVMQELYGAGLTNLTWSDVDVTFQFQPYTPAASDPQPTAGATEPYQGVKNQPFTVAVNLKSYNKVRWVTFGIVNPKQVTYTVQWRMLVDDPFTVNPSVPTW
jgi:Flp pilus assembly protein TadG